MSISAPSPSVPRPRTSAMVAGLAVAFTVFAWASAFPLIRVALHDMAPLPLAAARFAVASVLVTAWLLWKRPARPSWSHMLRFVVCGMIGIALYNALLNAGQQTVTAGAASFIVNAVPIITAIFATLFLGERFNRWGWIGSAVSFTGIALLVSNQQGAFSFDAGASLVLVAACCQAIYFILQRSLVPYYGALTCTAYTLLSGAVLLTPWLPEAVYALSDSRASSMTFWSVIVLGVLPAALGYAAWTYAIGHYGAARAANFLYLVPPIAIGLAFVMIGELPGLFTLLGGAIAILGVVIVNVRGRT